MSTARVFLFARPMDERDRDERLALLGVTEAPEIPYRAPAATGAELDRRRAEHDYRVNVKAELEIELLHDKIDVMKEQELLALSQAVRDLSIELTTLTARLAHGA